MFLFAACQIYLTDHPAGPLRSKWKGKRISSRQPRFSVRQCACIRDCTWNIGFASIYGGGSLNRDGVSSTKNWIRRVTGSVRLIVRQPEFIESGFNEKTSVYDTYVRTRVPPNSPSWISCKEIVRRTISTVTTEKS